MCLSMSLMPRLCLMPSLILTPSYSFSYIFLLAALWDLVLAFLGFLLGVSGGLFSCSVSFSMVFASRSFFLPLRSFCVTSPLSIDGCFSRGGSFSRELSDMYVRSNIFISSNVSCISLSIVSKGFSIPDLISWHVSTSFSLFLSGCSADINSSLFIWSHTRRRHSLNQSKVNDHTHLSLYAE